MSEENKFRQLILKHLKEIGEECKGFAQTTHGGGHGSPFEEMGKAYEEPDSYRISEFHQCLDRFLRNEGVEPLWLNELQAGRTYVFDDTGDKKRKTGVFISRTSRDNRNLIYKFRSSGLIEYELNIDEHYIENVLEVK